MPVRRKPDQRKPHQRRRRQIEPLQAVGFDDGAQLALLPGRIVPRQIDQPPRHRGARHHHLHGPAQLLMPEAGSQAGVPPHHGLQRGFQHGRIEQAFKLELELHRVDVRSLRIVERMEQQTLLQRRQRQDVLDRSVLTLQPFDLALRQIDQHEIARRPPAGTGLRRMPGQRRQRPEPGLGQIADRRFIEQRAGPHPVRRQPRAVRFIQGQRVDLDQMRQRQRRIAAATTRLIAGVRSLSSKSAGAQSAPSAPAANRPR